MPLGKSIRDAVNKLFRRETANDNDKLQFTVSKKQAARAHDAPYDNSIVEEHHGVKVSDPFRPLEDLDAPETAAWTVKQKPGKKPKAAPGFGKNAT